jgi:hypothetical protein
VTAHQRSAVEELLGDGGAPVGSDSILFPDQALPFELDWTEASGYAMEIDFSVEPAAFTVIGLLGGGTIELAAAGTTSGAAVTGAIDVDIYENLF